MNEQVWFQVEKCHMVTPNSTIAHHTKFLFYFVSFQLISFHFIDPILFLGSTRAVVTIVDHKWPNIPPICDSNCCC